MVHLDDTRSLAAAVAARCELRDVRLFQVEATLHRLPTGQGHLSYSFDAEIDVQHVPETSSLIVDGTYRLTVTTLNEEDGRPGEQGATEDDHESVAQLNFQLAALYALDSTEQHAGFPEQELDAFGKTTGLLALHPYAREFVATMTGRMGLPPLHLGTLHIPLDKRNQMDTDQ
jgi:hypothetical protein